MICFLHFSGINRSHHFYDSIDGNATNDHSVRFTYNGHYQGKTAQLFIVLLFPMPFYLHFLYFQRRHKLMLPWLIISGIGVVCNVIKFLSSLVFEFSQGFYAFMVTIFLGFLIIGKIC